MLVHITGPVTDSEADAVEDFAKALLDAAYHGKSAQSTMERPPHSLCCRYQATQAYSRSREPSCWSRKSSRCRSMAVTECAQGKGVQVFAKKVEPLFRAAHTNIDITCECYQLCIRRDVFGLCTPKLTVHSSDTTHSQHALEIARELPLGKYDAVVAMSGDGLIHEVLNGFAQHRDPIRALRTPIAPIPVGSANGLSLNILGLEVSPGLRHCSTRWGSLTLALRKVLMSPPLL